ncbi:MAG: methionine--tRNA ligase subunit beta, partial [Methanobacteriales archaeon HGW-Methanobacteriales-2]
SPYLPVKAGEMREILGLSHDKNDILKWEDSTQFIPAGTSLIKAKPLFAKIDDETIEKEKNALYTNLEETETMDNLISIEDFAKLDLRVGKIIGAEKVKGSEKLLKLMVDVKDKQLQVVAGLATKYSSEDLLNQKVIILVNLKPAKLFGIKSEGMVLAAGDSSCILTAPDAGVGEGIR